MMAKLSSAGMAATSSVPAGSGMPADRGSRDSCSTRRPKTMIRAQIGTLIRNTQRHDAYSVSSAPRVGPRAAAAAPIAPQVPIATCRRAAGNSGSTRASELGTTSAAKAPCSARAAVSTPASGAAPHSALNAAKPPSPARNSRLRPYRSASRPAGMSIAANTRL